MNKILLAIILSSLTACGTTIFQPKPYDKLPLDLPNAPVLQLDKVEFTIIHKDNAEKVFAELEKAGLEPILFGLTGTDYKALATNTTKIRNFLILQQEILTKYREYYEPKQTGK